MNYVLFENMKIVDKRRFENKDDIVWLLTIYDGPQYHIQVKLVDVNGVIEYDVVIYEQLK